LLISSLLLLLSEEARKEMRESSCRDEVVPAGGVNQASARRRRRLEHRRRLGRTAAENAGAKRSRRDASSASLPHGAVSVIGRRSEMEDAVAVARTSPAPAGAPDFFAVYDGHGGARVARACRERMHVVLAEELGRYRRAGSADDGWKDAMAAAFARVDGEVAGSPSRTVGSTAVVAVVARQRIVVANCGDSRAVLSRAGVPVPLSEDHKVLLLTTDTYYHDTA
jgi:protein phosphatase 2C